MMWDSLTTNLITYLDAFAVWVAVGSSLCCLSRWSTCPWLPQLRVWADFTTCGCTNTFEVCICHSFAQDRCLRNLEYWMQALLGRTSRNVRLKAAPPLLHAPGSTTNDLLHLLKARSEITAYSIIYHYFPIIYQPICVGHHVVMCHRCKLVWCRACENYAIFLKKNPFQLKAECGFQLERRFPRIAIHIITTKYEHMLTWHTSMRGGAPTIRSCAWLFAKNT